MAEDTGNDGDEYLLEEETGQEGDNADASLQEDAKAGDGAAGGDPELDSIESKIKEVEQEAEKLMSLQAKQKELLAAPAGEGAGGNSEEIDSRSIHIGNLDFATKPDELQQLFLPCGTVNRVTILRDKFTNKPKGFAYLEFSDPASVEVSLALDGSLVHNRAIKVSAKRTNVPSFMRGGGRGASRRPFRGRGMRRGGGFRGRGRGYFAPY
eukprot:m.228713 g.228713  ORF g.228713 m.228713 type:complete len:210 (-) comp11776_c0_seq1:66-695(-)